jgi:hypothetical protein
VSPVSGDRVLAVLDDASVAAALLDASAALAGLTHRELQVVYVESAAALAAAALPVTRVLAHAAQAWSPFAPADVERGWRLDLARLRTIAEQASMRRAVRWSLRVTRGALRQTAIELCTESDLLLVAGMPAPLAAARTRRPRGLVAAFDDGSAAGRQAVQVATQLAAALGARLRVSRPPATGGDARAVERADLLVLPSDLRAPADLVVRPVPLLLVGAPR